MYDSWRSNRGQTSDDEFGQPWGKAYLAPAVDFATKEVLARDVSESPGLAQRERTLTTLRGVPPAESGMVMASDRGWQYQHPRCAAVPRGHGVRQSMSRKENCRDSAATEQFFGRLKDGVLPGPGVAGPRELQGGSGRLHQALERRGGGP